MKTQYKIYQIGAYKETQYPCFNLPVEYSFKKKTIEVQYRSHWQTNYVPLSGFYSVDKSKGDYWK